MRLGTFYQGLELHRCDRVLYGRFITPHRVASTCQVSGGVREDLEVVYNHQICEPVGHEVMSRSHDTPSGQQTWHWQTHQEVCARHNLPSAASAGMATAANVRCAGLAERGFRDLVVLAACTAGIEGNSGRAGDPASWFERDGHFEQVSPVPQTGGTINTLLFISHELTPGALVRSLVTATEAKTAVLQELVVGSRYSSGRATGTGTDQIASACRLTPGQALTGAGQHSVLGQLIGETVGEAIRHALVLQNGLTPQRQRSVVAQLARFGVTRDSCQRRARQLLPEAEAALFERNFPSIDTDPMVVAAASALAEVADQLRATVLPASCGWELCHRYGTGVMRAVSGTERADLADRTARLLMDAAAAAESRRTELEWLVPTALALGFGQKWDSRASPP